MRALLDTDVILDVLLDRPGFAERATALWMANEQGRFDAYVSPITPVNVFYIARKLKGKEAAKQAVSVLLATMRVCPLDDPTLRMATTLPLSDFEDAVQLASAMANQMDCLVTRNLEDSKNAALPVYSPAEFLALLSKA